MWQESPFVLNIFSNEYSDTAVDADEYDFTVVLWVFPERYVSIYNTFYIVTDVYDVYAVATVTTVATFDAFCVFLWKIFLCV